MVIHHLLEDPSGPPQARLVQQALALLLWDPQVQEACILTAYLDREGLSLVGLDARGITQFCSRPGARLYIVFGFDLSGGSALGLLAGLSQGQGGTGFSARMYNGNADLFHPKLWVLRRRSGDGHVVMLSANLTAAALTRNVEVGLIMQDLSAAELAPWWDFAMKAVGSSTPVMQANLQGLQQESRRRLREARRALPRRRRAATLLAGGRVLVRKLVAAGNRYSQAHFTRDEAEGFFGLTQKGQQVWLRHVPASGPPAQWEHRPLVIGAPNRNRRLEMQGIRRSYPKQLPTNPVYLVIWRLRSDSFAYSVVGPGDPSYGQVQSLLRSTPRRARSAPSCEMDLVRARRVLWGLHLFSYLPDQLIP